jgi:acetyl esterase/lipase
MTRLRENTMKIQTTFEKRKVNLGANRWGTIGALALAAVVLATASVGGKSRRATSPKPTVANVAYDKHKLTQFDFWQAKGEGPRPLLIFIHGGGWYSGDKTTITPKVIPDLNVFLDKGVSVASVNYRKSPNAPLPAPDRNLRSKT